MRREYSLNRSWRYVDDHRSEYLEADFDVSGWTRVDLPHTNRELPYDYFDETDYQFVSTYARDLDGEDGLPGPGELESGARVFLDFGAVMSACNIYWNGRPVGSHRGGYTPFSVELSDALRASGIGSPRASEGRRQSSGPGLVDLAARDSGVDAVAAAGLRGRLAVVVDSTERDDVPPFGGVVDYLSYGGIYREVRLRVQADVFITDLHVRALRPLEAEKTAEFRLTLDRRAGPEPDPSGAAAALSGDSAVAGARSGRSPAAVASAPGSVGDEAGMAAALVLDCAILGREGTLASRRLPLPPGATEAVLSLEGLRDIQLWDTASPVLYRAVASLYRGDELLDTVERRIGFREAIFRPDGFYLNGRRLSLVGLNRHQSYPYVGYAMPARVQRRDAELLKKDLALDIVRTSHYPQSVHFMDACDELGLLVFTELPGWQHIGGAEWKETALESLREMMVRDRSRPSVVLWGTRINESQDDHEFYVRSSALARSLDPDRQIGGVRYIRGSEFLEDVYTFNDFVHTGGNRALRSRRSATKLRKAVPYLVTEHTGHMFPTKRFDQEERLVEHSLRHLRVMEASRSLKGVAGAIGWCATDYNTHRDFGSGDRICYHGVCDMFRIPKAAAAVYACRRDPAEDPYLEALSLFAKGERDAARLLPIYVFTNCDEVVLYRGGQRIGAFAPDRRSYPRVDRPPVVIRDLMGERLVAAGFSPSDAGRFSALAGKVLEGGMESLSPLDLLRFGLLLAKTGRKPRDAEALVMEYGLGWGRRDENFELAGLLGGVEVVRRTYGPDAVASRLAMAADDGELAAGDWDATRVLLRLEDQYGNPCPFAPEVVELSVDGPGSVIGPTRLSLIGGYAAFWLRSSGEAGTLRVSAVGTRFTARPCEVHVV